MIENMLRYLLMSESQNVNIVPKMANLAYSLDSWHFPLSAFRLISGCCVTFHSDLKNTNNFKFPKFAERLSSDSYNFILTCGTRVYLTGILRDETIQPK